MNHSRILKGSFRNNGGIMTTTTAKLHKIPAAMERLGIGRSKLYELMDSGAIRSVKVGKSRLISESAIVEFINRLDQGAA